MPKTALLPKSKCCASTSKCKRCPLRMLKEGTLPEGYTVKKRKLVKVPADGKSRTGDTGRKNGKNGKKKVAAAA